VRSANHREGAATPPLPPALLRPTSDWIARYLTSHKRLDRLRRRGQ